MHRKHFLLIMVITAGNIPTLYADHGTVTFDGDIKSSTCKVSVNGGDANAAVTLPIVSVNGLNTAKRTAGRTQFNLELTECSDVTKTASAFFEQGNTVDIYGRLINSGTAKKVNVQILDFDNNHKFIKIGDLSQINNNTYTSIDSTGKSTLRYAAEYYAIGGDAETGTVATSVNYNIQYK